MSRFITYLALERHAAASAEDTIDAFGALAGEAPMRIEATNPTESTPGSAFIVTVNGAPVTVMFIDKPLPPDAWQGAAARSLTWRDATETMQLTQAHVVMALLRETADHGTALNGAAAVTMLAGALATMLPVAATVFTEADAIVPGEEISKMAAGFAAGRIPDMLWVTLSFLRGEETADGDQTVGALTTGLRPFIGRELEFLPAPLQPGQVAQRLVGLCHYLIANGPVVADGETVGLTEKEKIRVSFAGEGRRPGVPVMRLHFETADAAAPSSSAEGGTRPPRAFGKRGRQWSGA